MYPAGTVKIIMSGGLPGGESWSTSFALNPGNVAMDNTELTNTLTAVDQAMGAGGGFYAELAAINPSSVTLTKLTGYQYQGGIKAATQAEITSVGLPNHTNALTLPNQISAVLSLRTGRPGRAYRGRMYVPVLACQMTANGTANTTLLNLVADGLATSFGTINASGQGKVVIGSQTSGQWVQVTSVQVDNVLDTQRRRRDKLTGTIHTASVAA